MLLLSSVQHADSVYIHIYIYIYIHTHIYRASLVTQRVKHLPAMQETQVQFLGWEDPLEKEIATHSSTLAWKIPWTEKPNRLQSMWSQRVRHDFHTYVYTHTNMCKCMYVYIHIYMYIYISDLFLL